MSKPRCHHAKIYIVQPVNRFFVLSAIGHYAHWSATLQFTIIELAAIGVSVFIAKSITRVSFYLV
ncbi:hypothetical protein ACE3MQ_08370 [Paenibacillus lentus]